MKEFYSALKPFVNHNTQWNAFANLLDQYIDQYQRLLEQSSDPTELYRAQGSIVCLKKLKKLRDSVNLEE